jgi:hypothetical protein
MRIDPSADRRSYERMFSEFPRVGKPCWVSSCTGYHLPPGLPERSRVTVMEWEGALGRCRDENGHDWTLCRTQIEPGIFLSLGVGRVRQSEIQKPHTTSEAPSSARCQVVDDTTHPRRGSHRESGCHSQTTGELVGKGGISKNGGAPENGSAVRTLVRIVEAAGKLIPERVMSALPRRCSSALRSPVNNEMATPDPQSG